MDIRKILQVGVAGASLLLAGQALAIPTSAGDCDVGDVQAGGVDADACAGSYVGNTSDISPNDIPAADWEGTAPSAPPPDWLEAAKSDTNGGVGVYGTSITDGSGSWVANIGTFSEFILGIKQGPEVAFYYFGPGSAESGTFDISGWAVGGGLVVSHISLYVRGSEVPEPATLALMGLGLAGLGIGARRRRKI